MNRILVAASVVVLVVAPVAGGAQASDAVAFTEWTVPFGGHPRDPMVAPDGSVFFVGQRGNYIAQLNPRSGEFKQFVIDSGTFPHNLVVDAQGMVWYAGNRNGMIGKLNPATGAITRYPMPDPTVRDPHTLIFDAQGHIWFTAQNSNAIGHLNTRTGAIRLVRTGEGTRPYGIVLNSRGEPWVNLFGTNKIAKVDPATMAVTTFDLPHERARDRRIALTSDDVVWYTDYTRGFLGRLDPATGVVTEFPMPGGAMSLPYGMAVDDKDRLWVTESGRNGVVMYGFDPKSRSFFGRTPIGRQGENNTIRHMYFDRSTGLLWFGTDQGTVGRAEVSRARTAM